MIVNKNHDFFNENQNYDFWSNFFDCKHVSLQTHMFANYQLLTVTQLSLTMLFTLCLQQFFTYLRSVFIHISTAAESIYWTNLPSSLCQMSCCLILLGKLVLGRFLNNIMNFTLARVVLRRRKFEHITPALIDLHWLPVHYRLTYKLATLTYSIKQSGQPLYLHELLQDYQPIYSLSSVLMTCLRLLVLDLLHLVPLDILQLQPGTLYQSIFTSVTLPLLLNADWRLSLIHIWRCRRIERCRSRWSPYH